MSKIEKIRAWLLVSVLLGVCIAGGLYHFKKVEEQPIPEKLYVSVVVFIACDIPAWYVITEDGKSVVISQQALDDNPKLKTTLGNIIANLESRNIWPLLVDMIGHCA